jgi:poly-D-alanine transfer protein DltD
MRGLLGIGLLLIGIVFLVFLVFIFQHTPLPPHGFYVNSGTDTSVTDTSVTDASTTTAERKEKALESPQYALLGGQQVYRSVSTNPAR